MTRKLTPVELAVNREKRAKKERRRRVMRALRMKRFRRKAAVRFDSMVLWTAKTIEERRRLLALKPDWMVYERTR